MMRKFFLTTILLSLCLFAAPIHASAAGYDPFKHVCQGASSTGNGSSAVCSSQSNGSDPLTGSNGLLSHITNIVTYAAGAAAIIIIIISALRLVTSGSDVSTGSRTDTDVEDARRSLANAAIGLGVIVIARLLILYVLKSIK